MSSKIIKKELDSFDIDSLELDEKREFHKLTKETYLGTRNILLEMIKGDNLGYHLNELKEIINEYDKTLK